MLTHTRTHTHTHTHSQVKANGLLVFVPKYGIEGPVYLTSKADNTNQSATEDQSLVQFVLDEEKQTVQSR